MLKFENELKKFKPVLNVEGIEEQIASEDMRDVIDLIKGHLQTENLSSDRNSLNKES